MREVFRALESYNTKMSVVQPHKRSVVVLTKSPDRSKYSAKNHTSDVQSELERFDLSKIAEVFVYLRISAAFEVIEGLA